MYDFVKLFAIVTAVMFTLLAGIALSSGGMKSFLGMVPVFGAIIGGMAVMFLLIMLVFFGNHFPMGFVVNGVGVEVASLSRRGKAANRLAVIAGLLSGRPGPAGAGLLAMSQETTGYAWDDIHKATFYPDEHVITLCNSWRVVLRLFCTSDNYSRVQQQVKLGLARGEALRARQLQIEQASPREKYAFFRLIAASLLAAAFLVPLEFDVHPAFKIFCLVAAVLAIVLRGFSRFFGGMLFAAIIALVAVTWVNGNRVTQLTSEAEFRDFAQKQGLKIDGKVPDYALGKSRAFDHVDTSEKVALALAGLASLWFLYLAGRAMAGGLEPRWNAATVDATIPGEDDAR